MAASALPDLESLAQAAREAKAEGAWAFMTALEEEQKGLAEGAWPGTLRLSKPQQNGKRALTAILPEALEGKPREHPGSDDCHLGAAPRRGPGPKLSHREHHRPPLALCELHRAGALSPSGIRP